MAPPARKELPASFRLPSRFTRVIGDTVLTLVWSIGLAIVGSWCFWVGALAVGSITLPLGLLIGFLASRPTTVVAGADGVAIRWLGLARFLPYDLIARDLTAAVDRRLARHRRLGAEPVTALRRDDRSIADRMAAQASGPPLRG